MARYIDADKFLESLISKFKCVPLVGTTSYMYEEECFEGEHIDTLINDQPTADVKEVKRGHWKHSEAPLGWQDVDVAVCSVCGEEWVLDEWDIKEFSQWNKFCPNCGADMRGDTDGNL